jgi:hypothetical protein
VKRIVNYGFIITVFLAFTSLAQADDTYIGLDIGQANLDLPRTSASPVLLRGRFGIIVFPESASKFGFEAHMGFGTSEESATRTAGIFNEEVKVELETVLGLYARTEFINVGIVGVYGLLGFSAVQTGPAFQALNDDGSPRPVLNTDTSTGLSYGLGVTFFVNKLVTVQLETLQIQEGDSELDFDVSSVSLGVTVTL